MLLRVSSNNFTVLPNGKCWQLISRPYFCRHDFNDAWRFLYAPDRKLQKLSSYLSCVICTAKKIRRDEWRRKKQQQKTSTSFPRGIPLPRAQVRPITLATNVLKVRYSFRTTPRSIVFISGIPEPARWKQRRWWSGEKRWVEREQLQREGWEELMESKGGGVRGKADWYSYSFLYAHLIGGIFLWICRRRDPGDTYSTCPW